MRRLHIRRAKCLNALLNNLFVKTLTHYNFVVLGYGMKVTKSDDKNHSYVKSSASFTSPISNNVQ